MSYSISTLLIRNLHDAFGENDPARRRAAIDEIFTEDIDLTRMRGPVDAALTFPALRAMAQEVSSLPFASRPRYVKWLPDAQAKHQLRI